MIRISQAEVDEIMGGRPFPPDRPYARMLIAQRVKAELSRRYGPELKTASLLAGCYPVELEEISRERAMWNARERHQPSGKTLEELAREEAAAG